MTIQEIDFLKNMGIANFPIRQFQHKTTKNPHSSTFILNNIIPFEHIYLVTLANVRFIPLILNFKLNRMIIVDVRYSLIFSTPLLSNNRIYNVSSEYEMFQNALRQYPHIHRDTAKNVLDHYEEFWTYCFTVFAMRCCRHHIKSNCSGYFFSLNDSINGSNVSCFIILV